MHPSCMAGRHSVVPGGVRNQGFEFSCCPRCGCDIVRSRSRWQPVPKGFRVVWRATPPRRTEISAAQFLLDLPSTGRALILWEGASRSLVFETLFLFWSGLRFLLADAGDRVWAAMRQAFSRLGRERAIRLTYAPAGAAAMAS